MWKQVGAAALVVGAAARVTRFVTQDQLGQWWIREPLDRQAVKLDPRWDKYTDGLDCPHCVGFWATALVVGAGTALRWGRVWQVGAGVWAASYVVGHLVERLDSEDESATFYGRELKRALFHFGDEFVDDEEED